MASALCAIAYPVQAGVRQEKKPANKNAAKKKPAKKTANKKIKKAAKKKAPLDSFIFVHLRFWRKGSGSHRSSVLRTPISGFAC